MKRNEVLLDQVTASIVVYLGEVNLYHYNKLTYLFEYFYIKNFAIRYTKEPFIKLPHGPVISNYKKQIKLLSEKGTYKVDLNKLGKKRIVDDYVYSSVLIRKTDLTSELLIDDSLASSLLKKVLDKFALYNVNDLEQIVYSTSPVINYLKRVEQGFKREIGGEILKGDCIRMKDYKNKMSEGKKLALKHLQKYPSPTSEQMQEYEEEFSWLKELRPSL